MQKVFGFIGMTLGGWLGWFAGAWVSIFVGFLVSMVGTSRAPNGEAIAGLVSRLRSRVVRSESERSVTSTRREAEAAQDYCPISRRATTG